jgi:RNA polymerase subunit RPABC4/transcription elongation factor Spt4
MKQCPKCSGGISDNTHRCPHCGYERPTNWKAGLLAVTIIFAVIFVLLVLTVGW